MKNRRHTVTSPRLAPGAWLVALLLAGTAATRAQDVPSGWMLDRWSSRDGLPVDGLTDVLQTRDGYVWIASWDGLVRFDGVRFTVFNRSNTAGLPANRLFQLEQTADGVLWIRTEDNRLAALRGGEFRTIGPEDGLVGRDVAGLFLDRDGRLIAATEHGVFEWSGSAFERLWTPPKALVPGALAISRVIRGRSGRLWVGTYDGALFEVNGGSTRRIAEERGRAMTSILGLAEDEEGSLWISAYPWQANREEGRTKGLFVVDSGVMRRVDFGDPATVAGRVPGAGTVFRFGDQAVVEHRGLRFFGSAPTGTWGDFTWQWTLPAQHGRTPDGRAFDLERRLLMTHGRSPWVFPVSPYRVTWDREGAVWLATNGQGLWRYRPVAFRNHGTAEGLPFDNVYSVAAHSSGEVWTSPLGVLGVSRFDPGREADAIVALSREAVLSLYEDPDRTLWVGTNTGACGFAAGDDGRPGDRCSWLDMPDQAPVYSMLRDSEGGFWIGGERSARRYARGRWLDTEEAFQGPAQVAEARTGSGAGGVSRPRPIIRTVRQVLPASRRVRAMAEDPVGVLWFGTAADGLRALVRDPGAGYEAGRFVRLTTAEGLPSNTIRDLYVEAPGLVWAVTEDAGLARIDYREHLDPERARISPVGMRQGFPEDAVHGLRPDGRGAFWISSNRGLIRADAAELNAFCDGVLPEIRTSMYTDRDGLRNREFNGGFFRPHALGPGGLLWFANQAGLVSVDVTRLGSGTPPETRIEHVVAGAVARPVGERVTLEARERSFEIAFTGLKFADAEDLRFRYRLEGYDDRWVDAGDRRSAVYTKVPAGTYRFSVAAAGKDGTWDPVGASATVVVRPFFYERAWFYLLCVLLAAGLVGAGFRWRLRQLRTRQTELEHVVAQRTREIADAQRATEAALGTVEAQAAKLRSLDAAKSRFFANISHEFRTPLTLILGPLQQMLREGNLSGVDANRAVVMQRNANRLLHLINQLLDLARLDAGWSELRLERSDLVEFCRALTSHFESIARLRNVELAFSTEAESLSWVFDHENVEKVLLNLLSNALKFTPAGGAVTVRVARSASGGALIYVSDTGIGIPSEHLEHVFDRFYQVDASTTRRAEGSGIGLALVHELVSVHGGRIEVRSGTGVGTTFSVELPDLELRFDPSPAGNESPEPSTVEMHLATAADPATGPALEEYDKPGGEDKGDSDIVFARRPTVLVVEDHSDLRSYMRAVLAGGYQVMEASDGSEGLRLALESVPDLVVSDVMMPGMDGFALCAALRDDLRTSHVPVVLLTARADAESRIGGYESGADDYVSKPFAAEELAVRIRNLIEQRRRLRLRYSRSVLVLGADDMEMPVREVAFLERIKQVVQERLASPEFGVDSLAEACDMSRSQLERKLVALVGETPGSLIRRIRLERAAQLLSTSGSQVKQVAASVGYRSVNHFSEAFRGMFGHLPSEHGDRAG